MLTNLRYKASKLALSKFVATPNRGIKLHEYQAGALLDKYKVAIPIGKTAQSSEEAFAIA